MFVGMWMTQDLITVEPQTALTTAATIMTQNNFRRLPVLATFEGEPRLVGILSRTDIARATTARTVGEAMTPDPMTTRADTPIEAVAAIMRECKVGALPVLRGTTLVGLITESDVFEAFIALFDLSSPGARITFDISAGEDILPFIADLAARHQLRISSFTSLHSRERPMCVVRVIGDGIDAMLEEVWRSHHRIESVVRTGQTAPA
ncbi:MAG TPA: CBS domain-containing protein [Povalibacter sp.]|nr:CBS domain-containing protein [Povalibacter sp.]